MCVPLKNTRFSGLEMLKGQALADFFESLFKAYPDLRLEVISRGDKVRPRRFGTSGTFGYKEYFENGNHHLHRTSSPLLPRRHSFACFCWLFIQPPAIRPNSSSTRPTYNNCRWVIQPRW
jgi:hypothetical protein